MKLLIAICFTLASFVSVAQPVDSAWLAKNYSAKFARDTGIILPHQTFIDEKGKERTLAEFKGKILYINVWATDCGSSVEGLVHLEQLKKILKAAQVDTLIQFVNICTEESTRKWKKNLKRLHLIGINLYCQDTTLLTKWNMAHHPWSILLDEQGKVMCFNFNPPGNGGVAYSLYAATKGIKPAESMWLEFRQQKQYYQFRKYTNDAEGQDFAKWYALASEEMYAYFQWQEARRKTLK